MYARQLQRPEMRRRGYLLAIITSKVPKYQRQSKTKNIQIVERLRQLDWVVIMLQAPCTGFRSISNSKTLWMRSASSGNDGAISYLMNTITKRGHGESLLLFCHPLSLTISSISTASSTTDKMENIFITEQQPLLSKEVLLFL